MHSTVGQLGGDLRSDTVTIIGATLDLQEKTAKQVSHPGCLLFQHITNSKDVPQSIVNDED